MRSPEKGPLLKKESASSGRPKSKSKLGSFIRSLFCCFSICGSGKDGISEDGRSLKSTKSTSSTNYKVSEESISPTSTNQPATNDNGVSERNRAPSVAMSKESVAWLSTWEEAIADGSQLLIQPAYKIPLYLILGYSDPATFLQLASTCHHIRSVASSLSPEFEISIVAQYSPITEYLAMTYLWNDNPMRMDQVVGLSRSNFKITVDSFGFIDTTPHFWTKPEHFEQTKGVLNFFGVKKIATVVILSQRIVEEDVFPSSYSPVDFMEQYKVKQYMGPYPGVDGKSFLSPYIQTMDKIEVYMPPNGGERKEVEQFVLNTMVEKVKVYGYFISMDIILKILKVGRERERGGKREK